MVPWPVLWLAIAVAVLAVVLAFWRGLSGWWLRGLTAAVLLLALANPALQTEDRQPLSNIVLLVSDHSASQKIGDRPAQMERAVTDLKDELQRLPNTEVRQVTLGDAPGDGGTLLMGALSDALAEEPRARVAGAILVTDGQVHDMARAPDMPAPVNVVLTGHRSDWDRRLIVKDAPAFAIMGEPVKLTLRVQDEGQVPADIPATASLKIAIDGKPPQTFTVPVGKDLQLPVTLPHGGMNVLQFTVPTETGELTDRNNSAVVQMNGVRDRLRVLLVSGEPHTGERVWRNLLKSDSSVDLVHFTILRPPEKQDGVPVSELSLIAFPTRELFVEKIKEFDLIIFDRYRRRGILPSAYLDNVKQYVENGGAVLVSAGPEFGSADSLWRSPLGDILPVVPTSQVLVGGFKPEITKLGDRHPVTEGLAAFGPKPKPGEKGPGWGRWFRQVEVKNRGGQVLMSGIDGDPLLVLKREGKGRVALLSSDEAWLWSRGYEGGGPQLELLRRLAHWMMKEPDLEEEALTASAEGQTITITRRSLSEGHDKVSITGPDDKTVEVPLTETEPGRFTATWTAPDMGLYRLKQGDKTAVIAVGPSAPKEFEQTIATPDRLAPYAAIHRGGVLRVEDGVPDVRTVAEGRAAAGRGWIGITPRHAYITKDLRVTPFLPAWAFLLIASLFALAAWLREGRR
ncbi:hypothetical protein [Acidimangrovimonas sediminis]|uniref:hypothetical protein n=1 Tax=Acidimangrovimonas sediminis TaxID=2056283 RepID=UPI000C802190|nr:hypothetical protein [Acidimangrovimonas sediminis]